MMSTAPLPFDNTFVRELGDLGIRCAPEPGPSARLRFLNAALAAELGWQDGSWESDEAVAILGAKTIPPGAEPFAQVYAGHQFGNWSPRLGDGRALLIGEVVDRNGHRRDLAWKGSGRTPFSRGGDGRAALGPMLREALISEAMHALGIPTTRALAVVATGEPVFREVPLPGAVLTRVASSHLRVGTFEYFAAQGDRERLRRLAEYAIARHDPDVRTEPDRLERFFGRVVARQARLVAQWMNVGFIHGVMNTDNMTVSGETIDYGPCAFLEGFAPSAVFSSIDRNGRYAFGNQPRIAQWNLARLAESLLALVLPPAASEGGPAAPDRAREATVQHWTDLVIGFDALYETARLEGQRRKLGLMEAAGSGSRLDEADRLLVAEWLDLLEAHTVDHTRAWRRLADVIEGDERPLRELMPCGGDRLDAWLRRWRERCGDEAPASARAVAMRCQNPWLVPRHVAVEHALDSATDGDLAPFDRLLGGLRRPYDVQRGLADLEPPAPAEVTAAYRTFCGT